MIDPERIHDINRAEQVGLTPHDLLIPPAGVQLAGADVAMLHVRVHIPKAVLRHQPIVGMLLVVQIPVMFTNDKGRIDPRAVAATQVDTVHQRYRDVDRIKEFAIFVNIVVRQPDKTFIPPLRPFKMVRVGLKRMPHTVPGLNLDVRC